MPNASPPYATPEFRRWLCRTVRRNIRRQQRRELLVRLRIRWYRWLTNLRG